MYNEDSNRPMVDCLCITEMLENYRLGYAWTVDSVWQRFIALQIPTFKASFEIDDCEFV